MGDLGQGLIDAALWHMEEIEYHSLVWGSVDGGFDRDQLAEEFAPLLKAAGYSDPEDEAEELIEELIEKALVCECATYSGKTVLRSRFAEGIRLMVRLRQLFPKRDWRIGPSLVSDYRVDIRPRRYPLRDQCPLSIRKGIAEKHFFSPVMTDVWDSLVSPDGTFLLAGFQRRAAESVLSEDCRGVIVTAGTGSGKTLAFYLPALTRIGEFVSSGESWTKCLAIYPRVELLKDQFAESLDMCSRIRETLIRQGRRPLTIGTLFNATPERAQWVGDNEHDGKKYKGKWPKALTLEGVVCPYSHCPVGSCDGDLVWLDKDWKVGRERLLCQNCGYVIEDDSIVLTRERAKRCPPDILFTTMEMVHKRLADPEYWTLLGIEVPSQKSIPFVLLDEVHTYTGLPGGQGAMVLRRWKHASKSDPVFVGLSATLLEARQFFYELTGVPEYRIEAIEAFEHEMFDEGAEYQVVIQGNPVSQTSLLSTSIQSCMLMARLQDPPDDDRNMRGISEGRYGRRVFAFTDDLDVNNRLYDDLRDAEGIKAFGPRTSPLAILRGAKPDERLPVLREVDGQRWKLAEQIGHRLDTPLEVGRTSSRDPGVARRQNLIVATASLEVGYNDSEVGCVLQHKAPKGFASFVQRKGRAGRKRTMRPWTVTVLTAFGQDRQAFQNYHHLFDPTLSPQNLPIRNLYLVRMQALSACLEWLALQWKRLSNGRGWLWRVLSTPEQAAKKPELCRFVQERLAELMAGDSKRIQSLAGYIKNALDLTDEEVESVLYAPPRSLLLEALPTLYRRLTTKWQIPDGESATRQSLDMNADDLPLPEFIAPNLFSQLALPEVIINIEGRTETESLPVVRALREIVPGRVTRRYAEFNAKISHWVALDDGALLRDHALSHGRKLYWNYPLTGYVESTPIGRFPLPEGGDIMVHAPFRMRLAQKIPKRVSNMSNSRPIWHTQIFSTDTLLRYAPALRSKWNRVVSSIDCYIHAHRSTVTVRRYSIGAEASLKIGRENIAARISFVDETNAPTALGLEFDTDGIAVRYRLPLAERLAKIPMSKDLQASLRLGYYRHTVLQDPVLRETLNNFQLEWIQRIYMAAVIAWATVQDISLEEAHRKLRQRQDIVVLERAMQVIIGLQEPEEGAGIVEGGEIESPLYQDLTDILKRSEIIQRLHELGKTLYLPEPIMYFRWVREQVHESMAAAVYDACVKNVPRHATMGTLLVDADKLNPDLESAVIWITEDTLGGSGVMEALAHRIAETPSILYNGIESSVATTDLEFTAFILERVVRMTVADDKMGKCIQDMRSAIHHRDREQVRKFFDAELKSRGLILSKSAYVALNALLLRPGTQPCVDILIVELIDLWDELQNRFGIAIGLQEFCALAALNEEFAPRIKDVVPLEAQQTDRDIAAQLYGILWPRQHEVRRQKDTYNPFRDAVFLVEPKLVSEVLLKGSYTDVRLGDPHWRTQLRQSLGHSETCRLIARRDDQLALAKAIAELPLLPVDIDYLQFYPIVERYEQGMDYQAAIITIWEDI